MVTIPNVWAENKIKGNIAETIVEELFRELGFYVIRLGQEHTLTPITQLKPFIKSCGGKFYTEPTDALDMIRALPDFVVIDANGNTLFIEVKFMANAYLKPEKRKVMLKYPSYTIVVNTHIDENLFQTYYKDEQFHGSMPQELRNERFWVWELTILEEEETEEHIKTEYEGGITSLPNFLEHHFGIKAPDVIKKYEALVLKYLPGGVKDK